MMANGDGGTASGEGQQRMDAHRHHRRADPCQQDQLPEVPAVEAEEDVLAEHVEDQQLDQEPESRAPIADERVGGELPDEAARPGQRGELEQQGNDLRRREEPQHEGEDQHPEQHQQVRRRRARQAEVHAPGVGLRVTKRRILLTEPSYSSRCGRARNGILSLAAPRRRGSALRLAASPPFAASTNRSADLADPNCCLLPLVFRLRPLFPDDLPAIFQPLPLAPRTLPFVFRTLPLVFRQLPLIPEDRESEGASREPGGRTEK